MITHFSREQPGFLDFSYRIKSLSKIFQVTVVSSFPLSQEELIMKDVEYIVLPSGEGRGEWLRYLWACGKLLRARRPHCAVLLHSAVAPITLLAPFTQTALYWNEHPTHFAAAPEKNMPLKRLIRHFFRWLLFLGARNASIVMPIGEAHRDDLLAQGCHSQRIHLLYMGVGRAFASSTSQQALRQDEAPLQLIYVGSVSKERGRDVMLEALAMSNRDANIAYLTLVGASETESLHCQNYAQQLGITDSLRVIGRVPGATIPTFLQHADAGICLWEDQPWWRFNPPTKLFEYLVAGLPVMASDIRTHTAYVVEGGNGFIFTYDSRSLANVIQAMWKNRQSLQRLKRQARASGEIYLWQHIEPHFLQAIVGIAKPCNVQQSA